MKNKYRIVVVYDPDGDEFTVQEKVWFWWKPFLFRVNEHSLYPTIAKKFRSLRDAKIRLDAELAIEEKRKQRAYAESHPRQVWP